MCSPYWFFLKMTLGYGSRILVYWIGHGYFSLFIFLSIYIPRPFPPFYEGHSKSIRPWSIKKIIVYISTFLFYHLQSTPVGSAHTSPSGAATSGNICGMPKLEWCRVLPAVFLIQGELRYQIFVTSKLNCIFLQYRCRLNTHDNFFHIEGVCCNSHISVHGRN